MPDSLASAATADAVDLRPVGPGTLSLGRGGHPSGPWMLRRVGLAAVAGSFLLLPTAAAAQIEAEPFGQESSGALGPPPMSVTSHRVVAAGKPLRYTAIAGHLPIRDPTGEPRANVFFVAYMADGAPPESRPITFAFNGGPGQPAVWLHLGIGPRRAAVAQPDTALAVGTGRRPELVDNPHTWLADTDLVFVDPVSTGYSRPAAGHDPSEFHGYMPDVEYLSDFVRLFITRFGRWGSPKYLVGESYGTTRVAGMAAYLQRRHGLDVDGVILISAILNWQTARFHIGNDLPFLLFTPTYAATAWYHGRLAAALQAVPLEEVVHQARDFALGDYATALLRGSSLPNDERERVVQGVARLTGLSPEFVERTNLRIHARRFAKELRRRDRLTVGRLDSRYMGADRDAAGEIAEFDPAYFVYGDFTELFNGYVRDELEYRTDLAYEIRAGDLVRPWGYGLAENRYLNVAEDLRAAMHENPSLRLFVASGYYDLATPFAAVDYTLGQMQLAPALRDNVTVHHYPAGHMIYIHPPSLAALGEHIATYYHGAPGRR